MLTHTARLLTRTVCVARLLTRMTRWLTGSHIIHTRYSSMSQPPEFQEPTMMSVVQSSKIIV